MFPRLCLLRRLCSPGSLVSGRQYVRRSPSILDWRNPWTVLDSPLALSARGYMLGNACREHASRWQRLPGPVDHPLPCRRARREAAARCRCSLGSSAGVQAPAHERGPHAAEVGRHAAVAVFGGARLGRLPWAGSCPGAARSGTVPR